MTDEICLTPWYELNIMANRRVGCCCYYNGYALQWDNRQVRDLFAYWNGPLIRQIRDEVARGEAGGGCADCAFYRFKGAGASYAPQFFAMPSDLNAAQAANWRRAVENYRARRIEVDHVPLRFYFNFGMACNLACVMCGQTAERDDPALLNPDVLWAWRDHYAKAERLSLIGGEPLALAPALDFIRRVVDDRGLDDVTLDLYSNGVTLDRHLDLLSAKRRISICVSLDGVGATYEAIRKGGAWARVERNLLAFKERGARLGHDWRLTTANLIMKTSLANLVELAAWHVAHDIQPNFSDFSLAKGIEATFLAENVFEFPHLLEAVPDWAQQLDQSCRLFEKKGWWEVGTTLRTMKLDLIGRLYWPRSHSS